MAQLTPTSDQKRYIRAPSTPTSSSGSSSVQSASITIKTVDQIRDVDLQGTKITKGAILVRLKSDAQGCNRDAREKHMLEMHIKSRQYKDDKGMPYAGVECKLEKIFPAYLGCFPPEMIPFIKNTPEVETVTENCEAVMDATEPCWNWSHSRVTLPDKEFIAASTSAVKLKGTGQQTWVRDKGVMGNLGKDVTICIIDEGWFYNNDIINRVIFSEGETRDMKTGYLSHSTNVANLACGTLWGMAPEAKLWISSAPNRLTHHYVVVALERIALWNLRGRVILNMSFGFSTEKNTLNKDLADGVNALVAANVIPVVSAGNSSIDIANTYPRLPQSLPNVIVVGNTDITDSKAADSNYGTRVDVYAPGSAIPVKNSTNVQNGTSFSAALISGFLAGLLSSETATTTFTVTQLRVLLRNYYARDASTYTVPKGGPKFQIKVVTGVIKSNEATGTIPGKPKASPQIEAFMEQFKKDRDDYLTLAKSAEKQCKEILEKNRIPGVFSSRVKESDSLRDKLIERNAGITDGIIRAYGSTKAIQDDIVDLVGIRILLYVPAQLDRAIQKLATVIFPGTKPQAGVTSMYPFYMENADNKKIHDGKNYGYRAVHLRVKLSPSLFDMIDMKRFKDFVIEIQVQTIAMHAWSSLNHDLVYKVKNGKVSDEEKQSLRLLNEHMGAAEKIMNSVYEATLTRLAQGLPDAQQEIPALSLIFPFSSTPGDYQWDMDEYYSKDYDKDFLSVRK